MPPPYRKSLFFIFIDGLIEANGAFEYGQVYSEYISEYGAKLPYLIVYKHFFRIEYVEYGQNVFLKKKKNKEGANPFLRKN